MIHPSSAHQRSAEPVSADQGGKRSLATILRDHGPLSVVDAVDLVLDLCEELANAHMNGVVHGDLGVHRVRTVWPRTPGQSVDLFALAETDTAAFEFRASAGGIMVAPEQRHGGAVDFRVDIFAVGVLFHWLITGVAPGYTPLTQTLAGVPRPVALTIEACLSEDPAWRPYSVDDVAEAIGSFSSCPPERFAQIASRRLAQQNTRFVRREPTDRHRTLTRLDDAALSRELSAAHGMPSSRPTETLVMVSVQSVFGSAPHEDLKAPHDRHDAPPSVPADSQASVETLPSHALPGFDPYPHAPVRGYYAEAYAPPSGEYHAAASMQPHVASSAPAIPAPLLRQRMHSTPAMSFDMPVMPPPPRRTTSLWGSMAGFVATAAIAAVTVLVVARLSDRPSEVVTGTATTTQATLAQPAQAAQPSQPVTVAPSVPAAPVTVKAEPPVTTPSALPDARAKAAPHGSSAAPRSKPASSARTARDGAAVPPSREVAPAAAATPAAHGAPPATREAAPSEQYTVTSSALADALR